MLRQVERFAAAAGFTEESVKVWMLVSPAAGFVSVYGPQVPVVLSPRKPVVV